MTGKGRAVPDDAQAVAQAVARLAEDFPQVPHDTVVSVFTDSYRVVVEATGVPLVDKAAELALIRLEVRTGVAAGAARKGSA